ncbi:hypothetical protein ACWKSP_03030 [Micromonosporaceae bacterium Da 78-11]
MDKRTRPYYALGAVLLLSGLVHLGVLLATDGSWQGPLSWRKPMTFGLSFGLTLITIAWVASFLPMGDRARRVLLGAFAAACVTEVALITVQAWRHVPSHFNMETPVDTGIARVLAAGGGVLVVVIVALTVVSWRPASEVAPSMRLAVRAGLLALDVALAVGAVMIVAGVLVVVQGDQQSAYTVGARWKLAHFMPMHGILALPVLARLLARTRWPERRRVGVLAVAVAGYAVLCLVAVADSIAAVDPLHAPLISGSLAAAAVLTIGAAALPAVAGATSGRPADGGASSGRPGGGGPTDRPVDAQAVERASPR